MKTLEGFTQPTWTFTTSELDRRPFAIYTVALARLGYLVRSIRGVKCRSVQSMLDEFSAALQFPYYFGDNWPAFDECMNDLDWLSRSETRLDFGAGIVLAVWDSGEVLSESYPDALGILAGTLRSANEYFATPHHRGEPWDHDAIPFHVILHGHDASSFKSWAKLVELH